ncbi:MAG: hypothetical protein HYT46_00270 [Candidatus Vogelbacteria bacterium]|nr:hypothetical protein [Candidatus Vogelbacteria bacterium]
MAEIIPAIIGDNFTEVVNRIRTLEGAANRVHLDIMDGTFTAGSSWRTPDDLIGLDGEIKIEAHLMIRAPEAVIRAWAEVLDRIIFHVETTRQLEEIMDFFTGSAVEPGLALNLQTPISTVEQWLGRVKLVQLMAIAEIGEQGHPFDEHVFEKIDILRHGYPDVTIQVDGGVNFDNVEKLIAAGADNLIVGSAIWQNLDPLSALAEFQKLATKS